MQPPADPNWPSNHDEKSAGTIVLIGASIRSAAQSAQRAGFQVLGIDHFGDVDTRQACHEFWILTEFLANPDAMRRFRQSPIFMVGGLNSAEGLPGFLATANAMQTDFPFSDAVEPGSPPVANRPEQRWDDPEWLRKLSEECSLSFPVTISSLSADAQPPNLPGKRWLEKTLNSCGGLGVRWHQSSPPSSPPSRRAHAESNRVLADTGIQVTQPEFPSEPAPTDHTILQEWIPGRPHGATLISNGKDCRLLGVCRSLFTRIGDRPFVYRGSCGPVAIPHDLGHRLQNLGRKLVRATAHRGLLNIDLVINRQSEAFILEVNPRWSGSSEVIERWLQARNLTDSLFGEMFQACNGSSLAGFNSPSNEASLFPASPSATCPLYLKQIVFARDKIRFSRDQLGISAGTSDHRLNHPMLADFPRDGTPISSGDPICTLVSELPRQTLHASPGSCKKKGPVHPHRALLRPLFGSAAS